MFPTVAAPKDSQVPVIALSVVLGAGALGLFVYGLVRPVPMRNLADPVPQGRQYEVTAAQFATEPSARRKLANKKNAEWKQHCQYRFHDCTQACTHFPKNSEGLKECSAYCAETRATCETWAHN